MKKIEELLTKSFSESDWNEELAEQLFSIFMTSFSKGGVLESLQRDIETKSKNKIFRDFKSICEGMVKGYKNNDFRLMVRSIKKLLNLYRFINKI